MDKFVRKKPRLDLSISAVGSGAGIATHEPPEAETEVGPTERSDASEPVSWAYSLLQLSVIMVVSRLCCSRAQNLNVNRAFVWQAICSMLCLHFCINL
jgi:hypothetical protein